MTEEEAGRLGREAAAETNAKIDAALGPIQATIDQIRRVIIANATASRPADERLH